VERGNPLPYTLPEAKLRQIGMTVIHGNSK